MVDKYKLIAGILFTALWIQLCWGFICTDIAPVLERSQNYINLLLDGVYVVLGLSVIRARRDLIVFGSFVLIASVSAYLNHQGALEFFNGSRGFIGILFVPPIIRCLVSSYQGKWFVEKMDRMLYVFLWIQVFCIGSQFLRFGAGDHGGGSFGNGYSGMVSTLIYVISFYLMNKRWDENESYLNNLWANMVLIFLLFPTFLNETKISFLYFIGYFVLLMRIDRRFIIRLALSTPLMVILFLGIGYVYLTATDTDSETYDAEFFNNYLIGEDIEQLVEIAIAVQEEDIETDNLWVVDLPRYGRLLFVPDALSTTGGGMLLGAGIGQFKGGSLVSLTPFARKYNWLLRGSLTMLFFSVIELGIVGLVWILCSIYSLILARNCRPRAGNIMFYSAMVVALIFVYDNQLRYPIDCIIMFYIFMNGLQPGADDNSEEEQVTTYG